MKLKNVTLLLIANFMISACAIQKSPAPIEYGGRELHDRDDIDSEYKIKSVEEHQPKAVFIDSSDLDRELDDLKSLNAAPNPAPKNVSAHSKLNDSKMINHEVKPGETIEDIAADYGQSVEEIAALNQIDPPYHIEESEVIKIKVSKNFERDNNAAINSLKQKKLEQMHSEKPATDFIKPVNGNVETKFGGKTANGVNKGIVIAASEGDEVVASASGKVIYADYDATFGNLVIIKLDNKNIVTSYAHLSNIILDKGAHVSQGDVIGYVGKTGKVTKPQLHFAIREGKTAKDPEKFVSYK